MYIQSMPKNRSTLKHYSFGIFLVETLQKHGMKQNLFENI